ncbi:MAG: ATP-binding protein [Candidatus Babeliales bacterium]
MYPLSFIEFLAALEEYSLIQEILVHELTTELSTPIHEKCLRLVAEYLALGGMPAVVNCWLTFKTPRHCTKIQKRLLNSYKQGFSKYAKKHQIEYVSMLFKEVPRQLSKKFKYNDIEGDYRKRELQPALNLLEIAGIIHKVYDCAGQGMPLGAQIDSNDYKTIFLDVGLIQSVLALDLTDWFLNPFNEFINKGALVQAFVGQELLAYSDPLEKSDLYYWHRNAPSSVAEIDYLIQQDNHIIPVEVKSGAGTTLKSMHTFLKDHPFSPYGIRFSAQNYSIMDNIHSYPLYALAKIACTGHHDIKKSIEALL